MSISMIIATAATLYVAGKRDIETAADAAQALSEARGKVLSKSLGETDTWDAITLPECLSRKICEKF
jgi:hypothetical protein